MEAFIFSTKAAAHLDFAVSPLPMANMTRHAGLLYYLITSTLFWSFGIYAAGTDEPLCLDKAENSIYTFFDYSIPGTVVTKVPYRWCTANCPGWTRFHSSDIELVLLQFILPTVIFALVIPRKWHLDLSPVSFDFGDGLIRGLVKAFLSLIATGLVASADMILWIGAILALSGPMILSAIEEINRHLVSVRTLARSHNPRHHQLTREERLSILIALLCGNFEGDNQMIGDLRTSLSVFAPVTPNAPTLATIKARLESIMNGQASFGSFVGIPTAFFLAGLLYNAYQIADETASGINWTPYAIWLMTMVYVVIVSSAPLTGNNPSVVTMLVKTRYRLQDRSWYNPFANYYDEEISPTPMYDRATTKFGWMEHSIAYQNNRWFRETVKPATWAQVPLVISTGFTTFFASIMAYSIAYHVPWPREGCRSFSYLLYMALQTMLILLRLVSIVACQSLFSIPNPAAYNASGSTGFKLWQFMYTVLILSGFAMAFFISVAGSIFQIFGVYNNCHCRTPVGSWGLSADQKEVQLTARHEAQKQLDNKNYADRMTLAAVSVTGILCYFGWWYQKVMRRAIAVELERLR